MSELIFEVPATFDGCTVNDFLRRGKGVSYHLIKTLKRLDGPWGLFCNERPVRTVDSVRTGDRIILRWPEKETETSPLAAKVPVLYEACKYMGIAPDLYDPIEEDVKAYLRGE